MQMNRLQTVGRSARMRWSGLVAMVFTLAFAANATAQAPAAAGGAAPPQGGEDLVTLVGPIALYPDDLVAIILPASTNPLQIVQADRFLEKRKTDPKAPIDEKWDDPVKSLLNYPDAVKLMSRDLDWTSALGEAVVTDQGAVIEAVQTFRLKAQAAGSLKSDDKQVVKVEKETIIIQPADPQVIYVPQYNPTTVIVQSAPPVYYPTPYPSYYYPYPPGAALATGVIWGAAIGAAWSGNHYGCCNDANINVNKNTNVNRSGSGARQQGGSAWKSNKQPGQVSGSVGKKPSTGRAGGAGAGGAGGPGGAGGAGAAGGAGRASAQPAGAGGRGASGGDAMGGYGSGRQAQADSSRGASSRSAAGSSGGASARTTSSGGGARAGGGGGGARGGGGGGGGRGGGGGGRR
jgi:hypothetical protein